MNASLFIAKKLIRGNKEDKKTSNIIADIAVLGTVLSILVMIISIFISSGFKKNIHDKAEGFSADFQIINHDANLSYDLKPITLKKEKIQLIKKVKGVQSLAQFITKPAVVKYHKNIEGVVLKAYNDNFDNQFIKKELVEGKWPDFNKKEILISQHIAKKLNIKLGNKIIIYFVQNPIRFRKLKVTAIYNTNLQDFDKLFCFVSMPLLQKINHWNKNEVNGYEILTEKKESQQEIRENIDKVINGPIYSSKEKLQNLKLVSVQDKYPQLFFWLSLLHSNVLIIIILMLFVSAINLISALLIIIIENINKIGLLKAFGATNKEIRQIFLYYSIYLTVKGVLIGNLLALFLVWLQYQYHIIPLNAEHYYMSYVPVHFDWIALFWINIISIPLIIIILTVPTHYIAKISPVKVIRFQ